MIYNTSKIKLSGIPMTVIIKNPIKIGVKNNANKPKPNVLSGLVNIFSAILFQKDFLNSLITNQTTNAANILKIIVNTLNGVIIGCGFFGWIFSQFVSPMILASVERYASFVLLEFQSPSIVLLFVR